MSRTIAELLSGAGARAADLQVDPHTGLALVGIPGVLTDAKVAAVADAL